MCATLASRRAQAFYNFLVVPSPILPILCPFGLSQCFMRVGPCIASVYSSNSMQKSFCSVLSLKELGTELVL